MFRINPVFAKQINRFKRSRRGYYSFILLSVLFFLSLFSNLLVNNKPLVMSHQGELFFPLFKYYPAKQFGEVIATELDYKAFRKSDQFDGWMLFPPIPFDRNESMSGLPTPPPTAPTPQNWLGTDDRGRDLLTRLIYGFRNSFIFAFLSCFLIAVVAYVIGAVQGYLGGRIDLYGQRLIEIWSALPVLYVIILLVSLFPSGILLLTFVWVLFSWIGLATYIRAEVLRIRKMEFITAAKALGASTPRILLKHIFPNTLTPILTFSPFLISMSILNLAGLDYLGLGLPPPTASWGELLRQGKENLDSWWLVFYPFLSLFGSLLLLNFIGESMRSAFDSREVI